MRTLNSPFILAVIAACAAIMLSNAAFGQVIRVDIDSTANGPGTTWANAYDNLQDALAFARLNPVDEIWVAEGTYTPHASNRSASFDLVDLVDLYGGFKGTESMLSDRSDNPFANPVILSGDLSADDGAAFTNRSDNSYHVVTGEDVSDATIVDRFTIRGGYADGSNLDDHGGGVLITTTAGVSSNTLGPNFNHCIIEDNHADSAGGGMATGPIFSNGQRLYLTNCTIRNNRSSQQGGGIFARSGILRNCNITNNVAGTNGGGVCFTGTTMRVLNCQIEDNTAGDDGGGVWTANDPDLRSCLIAGNNACNRGGGVFCDNAAARITNCTVADNSTGDSGCAGQGRCLDSSNRADRELHHRWQ